MHSALSALILAAGRASRMGVPKVLLPARRGRTLLSSTLSTALASVEGQAIVVLGRDAELCRVEIKRFLEDRPQYGARVITVENPHYKEGLSTSLQCGVKEVLRLRPPTSGLMVSLADQPAFDETRAQKLVQTFRARSRNTVAVVAAERGEQRNPVILSAELLPELLEIEGDKGARGILKKYDGRVERLELGSGPWFVDTDDWTTYAELMRECGWLEEVFIAEWTGEISRELTRHIEAQLQRDPRPLLAPDVLLVGLEESRVVRLERPSVPSFIKSGIQSMIIGDSTSSEAYLNLLRRAALWTLLRG